MYFEVVKHRLDSYRIIFHAVIAAVSVKATTIAPSTVILRAPPPRFSTIFFKLAETEVATPVHMGLKHASREKNYYGNFFYFRAQKCLEN